MMERGKISAAQGFQLMIGFMLGSSVLFILGLEEAGKDTWLASLLAAFLGVGVVLLFTQLGRRFPGQTIVQYSPKVLGLFLGKTVGLIYIFYAVYLGSLVLRNFSDFLIGTVMPETPALVFLIILGMLTSYAVVNGLEILGRSVEFTLPMVLISMLLVFVLSWQDMRFENFLPPLEDGIKPLFKGTISNFGFPFGETILFAMLFSYQNDLKQGQKAYLLGMLAGGILLALRIILVIALLGTELSEQTAYPTYTATRYTKVVLLERLEPILMASFIITGFLKISVCHYAGALGLAQLFNLKTYKPLVLPLAVVMISLSLITYENAGEVIVFASKIWPVFSFPIQVAIPVVLLLISMLKKGEG